MPLDSSFFQQLAGVSDEALLLAVDRMKDAGNREGTLAFLAYAQANIETLGMVRTGETLTVTRHNEPRELSFPTVLVDALGIFEKDEQLDVLKSLAKLASKRGCHAWQTPLVTAVVTHVDSAAGVGILRSHGIDTDDRIKSVTDLKATQFPAVEAILCRKLHTALALLDTASPYEVDRVAKSMIDENAHQTSPEMGDFAQVFDDDPTAGMAIVNAIRSKSVHESPTTFLFRMALGRALIDHALEMQTRPNQGLLRQVLHATPAEEVEFTKLAQSKETGARPSAVRRLIEPLVEAHCSDLLASLGKRLDVSDMRQYDLIAKAVGKGSSEVKTAQDMDDLKRTIGHLMDMGHVLTKTQTSQSALHVLASEGHFNDLTKKLVALLELGADPLAPHPDGPAVDGLKSADQKDKWAHVIRSFKARAVGQGLIEKLTYPAP